MEDRVGSIEPGKQADIAIWNQDLYTMPVNEIPNLSCEMTVFFGRVVYER